MSRQIALAIAVGLLVAGGSIKTMGAKGPIDKITVSRFEWSAPVEVTDGNALDLLSPWLDDFLGRRLQGRPENPGLSIAKGAQVWLYVQPRVGGGATDRHGLRADPDGLQLVYYVDYYPDASGLTPGFIFLHDEPRTAALNNSTIIRPTGWYEATPAWHQFMASLSTPISPPVTGDGGLAVR